MCSLGRHTLPKTQIRINGCPKKIQFIQKMQKIAIVRQSLAAANDVCGLECRRMFRRSSAATATSRARRTAKMRQ
jgi:hypothetical protein